MKVTIEIGLPGAYLDTLDKDDIKELGDIFRNEYAGILAVMGIDNDGIEVDIKATEDGGFYARFNKVTISADDDEEPSEKEPSGDDSSGDGSEEDSEWDSCPSIDSALWDYLASHIWDRDSDEEDGVEEEESEFDGDGDEVDDEVDDILPTDDDDGEPCCDCGCCSSWEKCADTSEAELTAAECNTALLKLYLMLSYNCGEELHHEHGMSVLDPREKAYLLKRLFKDTGLDSIARDVSKALGKEH